MNSDLLFCFVQHDTRQTKRAFGKINKLFLKFYACIGIYLWIIVVFFCLNLDLLDYWING